MLTWVYALSKEEAKNILDRHGLDSSGKLDDLRKRLVTFVRQNPDFEVDDIPKPGTSDSVADIMENGAPPPLSLTERTQVLNQIRKWGQHFDGKDPLTFIERVEELGHEYGYEESHLLLGLPEMLKGNALLWFRNNRAAWETWAEFRQAFRAHYLPPGYQKQLKRDIQGRQQKAGEPFRDFVTVLQTMMRRAGGFSSEEQLEQIVENMSPDYQLYIPPGTVSSIEDLTARVAELEKIQARRKERQSDCPRPTPTGQGKVSATAYDRTECCWRCKQRGHTRRDCHRPAKKFCSQCGRDGVLTRECHPPPGNGPRAGKTVATARPNSESDTGHDRTCACRSEVAPHGPC